MSGQAALETFVRSIPLFSLVEPGEMMDILRLLRPVQLEPGQVLFREGEPGRAMWICSAGVEVSLSTTPSGAKRPIAVAYARAGDVVGEMALVDDGARSASAVVVGGGHAHEVLAQDFHALRDAFHPAAFKVLRRLSLDLCKRLRATNDRIVAPAPAQISTPPVPAKARPGAEVLDTFPAFKPLPAVVKLALAQKLQLIEVDGVTPLFAEGEPGDGAYFLLSGEVSVGRNGKTLANLVPGTMIGLVAAIDAGTRSASCITTGPATLLKLSARDFDALFAAHHRFAFQLVDLVARQLVSHLRQANAMLPLPGKTSGAAASARPMTQLLHAPADPEADLEVLPLELEMEVQDEVQLMGELLS
ncbi:MAG: cyclic nucleotide-binding domain-containing protein [Myxococcaceae bacterium]|nr:cyclic nucleotide-binding domain-containing protein [Myxococcaceae bacterium]